MGKYSPHGACGWRSMGIGEVVNVKVSDVIDEKGAAGRAGRARVGNEEAFTYSLPNRVMDGGEYTYDFETGMWRCRGTHCPGVSGGVGEIFFKNGNLVDESGKELSNPIPP